MLKNILGRFCLWRACHVTSPTHISSQKIDFEEVKKDLDALYTSTDQVSVAAWFRA